MPKAMITKTERIAVLFSPEEMALVDRGVDLYCRNHGIRSIKKSVLLRDILLTWAEDLTREEALSPSLSSKLTGLVGALPAGFRFNRDE